MKEKSELKTRLIAWRKARGMSQAQAAVYFGVAQSTFSHWEQASQPVPKGMALRLLEQEIAK